MNQETELEKHLNHQIQNKSEGSKFFWHRLRSEFIFKRLSKYIGDLNQKQLVDLGAGAGIFGDHLKKGYPNSNYFFVEPLDSLVNLLISRYGKEFRIVNGNFARKDAVLLLDVLEHQEKDIEFLKNIERSMDKGSVLVITVPAFPILWSKWDEKLGHFRRYKKSSLKEVFNNLNLEILEMRYIFQGMFFAGLFRRAFPSDKSEFPRLGKFWNECIYCLGLLEQIVFSKILPFGSSLVLLAKKI